jgi:hypothetical protein
MNRTLNAAVGALLIGVFTAACGDVGPTEVDSRRAVGDLLGNGPPRVGKVDVCAFPPEPYPTVNFAVTATAGTLIASPFALLVPPDCIEIWEGSAATVTAELLPLPAGYALESIVVRRTGLADEELTGVSMASVDILAGEGAAIWFKLTTASIPTPGKGETLSGFGTRYPNTSNWFMYTPYTTSKVDLVAGRDHQDAGDIFMSRASGVTTIRIVLHSGWSWDDVAENLKIQPFDSAPKSYVEPGSFRYKYTVSGNTVTVTIPGTKAKFYGIHGDGLRLP